MHDDNDKYLSMYCCQYVQYTIELAVTLVTRFFYFTDINNVCDYIIILYRITQSLFELDPCASTFH